jgi:hypothetical protein
MKIRLAFRILVIVFFLNSTGPALGMDNGWYFTSVEIANAYRYQERFGHRLRHPLKPHGCYYGQSEFIASFQGKEFVAPCRFITESTRQLKQMLENGAARYLFPLDADHAHLPSLQSCGPKRIASYRSAKSCRHYCGSLNLSRSTIPRST